MMAPRGVLPSLYALLIALLLLYSSITIYKLGSKLFYTSTAGSKLFHTPTSDKDNIDGVKRSGLMLHLEQERAAAGRPFDNPSIIQSHQALCSHTRTACEVIHIAVLSKKPLGSRQSALLIKSILIHRSTRIHFHFLVDDVAHVILKELFRTWEVVGVQHSFYKLADIKAFDGSEGLEILQLPAILPSTVQKVVVLNASRILNSDPRELWCLFDKFNRGQHIGSWIVDEDNSVRPGVMLLDLAGLRQLPWLRLCAEAKAVLTKASSYGSERVLQGVLDGLLKRQPELFFRLPCQWSYEHSDSQSNCLAASKSGIKVMDYDIHRLPQHDWRVYLWTADYNGDQLRDFLLESRKPSEPNYFTTLNQHLVEVADNYESPICSDYAKEFVEMFRTHLFYMDFDYKPDYSKGYDFDVTLVSQISVSRMSILERLCAVWPGPMSIAVYLKDSDTRHFESYVLRSATFSRRKNIAFHLVYQEGSQYPTNHLRNVASMGVKTSHAFLLDVDFMPVGDIHPRIMRALEKRKDYPLNTAFVVPAFETEVTDRDIPVPKNKQEMALLWDQGTYVLFRVRVFPEGHRASNYTTWRNATEPYQISWEYGYEPYIIMPSKDIPHYDERFLGYGGDKVSHIMELAARGYHFVVLPDVFIVHLPHGVSFDNIRFRASKPMRKCLVVILDDFGMELVAKYGNATLRGWKPQAMPPKAIRS